MKRLIKILPLLALAGFMACKKDKKSDMPAPETPAAPTGSLKVSFRNMFDTAALAFGKPYVNALGDSLTISKLNYFISNVVVVTKDNVAYFEPNSYHLVKHSSPASCTLLLTKVPPGSYKSISFMLGVDSVRNISGAQTGDLDPVTASDMYWDWNTGYVTFKMEGSSPQSGAGDKRLTYHMGGYGGPYKAQRMFNLDFGTHTADVSTTATPLVELNVNASKFFKGVNLINVRTDYNEVMAGPAVKKFADNYADMISFGELR